MSSFLSDTAVVVVMLPIVLGVAQSSGVPAAHLLMPRSFAALLGGMNAQIGTSTNIPVSGVAEDWHQAPIGMSGMTPNAIVVCVIGIAYRAFFAPRILPERGSMRSALANFGAREYLTELVTGPTSPLVGRRVEELQLWRDHGAVTIAILRAGQDIRVRLSALALRAGDLLLVISDEDSEARLRASSDFSLLTGAQAQVRLRERGRRALVISAGVVALFALGSLWEMKWLPQPFVALLGALASCGHVVLLSGFVLLRVVMNTLIAHSAVAVLLTAIAIKTGRLLAAVEGHAPGDPRAQMLVRAYILTIACGGSLCFAAPVGHQVALMAVGPGGYRYGDFVRLGLPLALIAWIVVSAGLASRFGL